MTYYRHALVLAHDQVDGNILLHHGSKMAHALGTKITVGHISSDYRELQYLNDNTVLSKQSHHVIEAKQMLAELAKSIDFPEGGGIEELVSITRFKDIETLIEERQIDLLIVGHKNRLFGVMSSYSFEFINRILIDVLVQHIPNEN
ncbi:universal stress protein [Celerinatantimonas yamalensis]|uniref:Universal stress protein n=1 Tax=Celerinatantimonas yamalensis TaxID=559956 RepID=A0ABW9G525_9GAMM